MATNSHFINLTGDQWKLLTTLSSSTGKSPEEILADALRRYEPAQPVADENGAPGESLYEALARRGLIGCLKGGPPDLSTNPKYMEGFGQSDR